jgi:hypothetical protein
MAFCHPRSTGSGEFVGGGANGGAEGATGGATAAGGVGRSFGIGSIGGSDFDRLMKNGTDSTTATAGKRMGSQTDLIPQLKLIDGGGRTARGALLPGR